MWWKFSIDGSKRCIYVWVYGLLREIWRDKPTTERRIYSRLNVKGISDQDYEHAQQVWNRITPGHENITLGDYHDIYLAADVLLLADVFETFRNTFL